MANVVDPGALPERGRIIPGLKPSVREFGPLDNSDPSEVDAFNKMIRELRNQIVAQPPGLRRRDQ